MSQFTYAGVSVPEHIRASLDRWSQYGIPPGDFLQAVLRNDLSQAIGRADDENRMKLHAIVCYVWNELPAPCWGSPEKVKAWGEKKWDEARLAAES